MHLHKFQRHLIYNSVEQAASDINDESKQVCVMYYCKWAKVSWNIISMMHSLWE